MRRQFTTWLRSNDRSTSTTHSTPQRAQSFCRMFLRSYDVGYELNFEWLDGTVRFQCESGATRTASQSPDKRIDVIMRYRLNLTKTIEEKTIR